MDYKKKLIARLYTNIVYIALGIMMVVVVFAFKPDNDFFRHLVLPWW